MKTLLMLTAALEAVTGLGLLASPGLPASMLIGAPLDSPAGLAVGRVAGAALLALGIACWLASRDEPSGAVTGLVTALLIYNFGVVAILAQVRLGAGLGGIGLVPAVVLHSALGGWCIACLRQGNSPGKLKI